MTSNAPRFNPDPAVFAPGADPYDENGVDRSLLRLLLAKSPLERLRIMERPARDTRALNEYGRRHFEAIQEIRDADRGSSSR